MASLLDRLTRLAPSRGPLASPLLQRVVLGILVVAVTAFPLVVQTPPIDLVEGAPAPRTIRANRLVQFVDEEATARARDEAAAAVEPVTSHDQTVLPDARSEVTGFFETAIAARVAAREATPTAESPEPAVFEQLKTQYPDTPDVYLQTASQMDVSALQTARNSAEQLVTTVLSRRFTADELPAVTEQMRESTNRMAYVQPVRELIAGIVGAALKPTLTPDEAATSAAREAASDNVSTVVIVKQAGENIVFEGEIVTAEDIEIVRSLGLLEQGGSGISFLALVAMCAVMVVAAGGYIWRYDQQVWDSLRDLSILATLFVGMLWATRLVLWWRPEVSVYLLPVPLAAMLATLLLTAREGMVIAVLTTLAAILLGFSGGADSVGTLVWAIAGVVAVAFMTDRRALFYVGASLVVSGASIAWLTTVASGVPVSDANTVALYGAIGGLLSAVLGYGLLPFFEYLFGVTTDVRLLELGNPTQPLLRELMVKAPGTYSHSVMTGNLAETAAEAIGARPLLARVGSYYHDVGKLRRPGFFIENQAGAANPHDSTAPSLSALIITAHVREGLELAAKHRLPQEVMDIIRQHHGTSLVSYFYQKASEGDTPVYETDFRYDGQKPQSPEAALVMLADAAEAIVRTVRKPTQSRIEASVRKVVDAKVADGQLDDARLTLGDIETIVRVYTRMLSAVYHPRIEYPDQPSRRPAHEHSDHEPSRS